MAGVLLLIARLVRLGFLANFLSRTVLIGFLTGVGISVAIGQLPQLLGIHVTATETLSQLGSSVRHLGDTSLTTLAVAAAVIVIVLVTRRIARQVPGALIAVIAAIVLSRLLHFDRHGIRVLGHVPSGVPSFSAPAFGIHDIGALSGRPARYFWSSSPRVRRPLARTRPATTSGSTTTRICWGCPEPISSPRSAGRSWSTEARQRRRWSTGREDAPSSPS